MSPRIMEYIKQKCFMQKCVYAIELKLNNNSDKNDISAAISLRLQGKLSFPYNCQKMNGQIYVLLC